MVPQSQVAEVVKMGNKQSSSHGREVAPPISTLLHTFAFSTDINMRYLGNERCRPQTPTSRDPVGCFKPKNDFLSPLQGHCDRNVVGRPGASCVVTV